MRREFQVLIFILIFSSGYYLLNFTVLESLGMGILSLPLTFLLPAAIISERVYPSFISRAAYVVSMVWVGMAVYILIGLGLTFAASLVPGIPFSPIPAAAFSIIMVSYGLVRVRDIEVRTVRIPFPCSDELRLVQLSDLHVGTVRSGGFLRRVSSLISEIEPDAVLITGDLLDGSRPVEASTLSELKVEVPVFFVSGNHDTYAGDFRSAVEGAGIMCIDQRVVDFRGVQVAGVGYSMGRHALSAILDIMEFDPKRPLILLHHLPVNWDDARRRGVDIQLSGHTHGGQFYPFNLLVGMMFPFIRGLYEDSERFLYVSQGTGTWGPPIRIGSSCEVTVIELIPSDPGFNGD